MVYQSKISRLRWKDRGTVPQPECRVRHNLTEPKVLVNLVHIHSFSPAPKRFYLRSRFNVVIMHY